MCGRYALISTLNAMRELFSIDSRANLPPRYNLAPRQVVMTVRAGDESGNAVPRTLAACEWGLVPPWMADIPAKPMINARVETVDAKPSFRSAFKRRRCLVPASAWYEWQARGGSKQPYAIVADSGDIGGADGLFAMAGIWEVWHGPDGGDAYQTVAILTTAADGPLKPVHHRRPLVVMPESYDRWLQAYDPLPRDFLANCTFAPESAFRAYPVDRRVGNVRFDDSACLQPTGRVDKPADGVQGELF